MSKGNSIQSAGQPHFPPQIRYIIGNEACERFSYYGMRAILVVFMTSALSMTAAKSKEVYHLFTAGCYLTPLLGAWIADRYLGKYKTILYLSLFYCVGHAALAIWENEMGLYLGLTLIALGSGGIKPCISAHVGDQFDDSNKSLLDKIYSLFYFSVNFGSFFSTLLTPWLLIKYGASWAFGVPGILMGVSTVIFWLGRNKYIIAPPTGVSGKSGLFPVLVYAFKNRGNKKEGQTLLDVSLAKYSIEEVEGAKAALSIFKVFFTVSAFWALFDQNASSWVLQAEKMDRVIWGYHFEASQIQAANPILVMLLIPVFTYGIYPLVGKLGIKVTPLRKMSVGMLLAAFSFVVVGLIQVALDQGQTVSVIWQFLAFLILTTAEVMVSITGLEFAYTQAPPSMKSTIMSFWLVTVFIGNLLDAYIARINVFSGSNEFFFFAALMFVVALIFSFTAARYKVRSFIEHDAHRHA